MKELLFASNNSHKLVELNVVAAEFGFLMRGPKEIARERGLPPPPEVEETGSTYRENALLKAEALMRWAQMASVADDSGLEVDALGGRPGVASARYAGDGASDHDRNVKLLGELAGVKERGARFRCYLVYLDLEGRLIEAEGEAPGLILDAPRGKDGFGYDPVVEIAALGKTFAEVDRETKCRHAARGQAARKLFGKL